MASDKTEFPVYLFSNASTEAFPNNKPNKFINQISQELKFKGKWEVGLSQICYPNNFLNIKDTMIFHIMYGVVTKSTNVESKKTAFAEHITSGFYKSIDELFNIFNSQIKANLKIFMSMAADDEILLSDSYKALKVKRDVNPPKFSYNYSTNKITFDCPDFKVCELVVTTGHDALRALGFGKDVKTLVHGTSGTMVPSLTMNFPSLFLYSKIVEPSVVGDVTSPLLALVPIHGEYNQYTSERFDKPLFVGVSETSINNIEIQITDVHGDPISFGAGIVQITLLFRRKY